MATAAPHTFYNLPLTYSSGLPITTGLTYGTPLTYSAFNTLPLTSFRYAQPVVAATAIQPGYFAQNPGATHVAPLPQGLAYASHHINNNKA